MSDKSRTQFINLSSPGRVSLQTMISSSVCNSEDRGGCLPIKKHPIHKPDAEDASEDASEAEDVSEDTSEAEGGRFEAKRARGRV